MRKSRLTLHAAGAPRRRRAARGRRDRGRRDPTPRELCGPSSRRRPGCATWVVMAWLLVGVAAPAGGHGVAARAHADDRDPGGNGGDPRLGAGAACAPAESAADVPRGAGAAIVLLLIVTRRAGLAMLVLSRRLRPVERTSTRQLQERDDKIEGWLKDLGVKLARRLRRRQAATQSGSIGDAFHFPAATDSAPASASSGPSRCSSRCTVLSLFFLLKDGPVIRGWLERAHGRPAPGGAHDQRAHRSARCRATSSA